MPPCFGWSAKAQRGRLSFRDPQLGNNIEGQPWTPEALSASMDSRSQTAVANLPDPRDSAYSLPAPLWLKMHDPPLLCKWRHQGQKGKGPDPRSHALFSFASWKRKDHHSPRKDWLSGHKWPPALLPASSLLPRPQPPTHQISMSWKREKDGA